MLAPFFFFRDPDAIVRPCITFSSCIKAFSQPEIIEKFYSSAINGETTASKTTRLSSFPEYLLLHLKKFFVNSEYQASKLDVAVEMPDTLDLSEIKGIMDEPFCNFSTHTQKLKLMSNSFLIRLWTTTERRTFTGCRGKSSPTRSR